MAILVDQDHAPMIHARFTGPSTDMEVKGYLAVSDMFLARDEPYALVIEAAKIDSLSGRQRTLFADWIARNEETIRRLCVGQAYVVPNIIQRMVIRSVFMIKPLPVPYRIASTNAEAWQWCVDQLDAAGIDLDPAARQLPAHLMA